MAGRQTTPEGLPDLQSLVRNIVSDIVGGNSESSVRENSVNAQNAQSSSAQSDNVTQELHARFGVPRNVYNPRQNYGRTTSSTPRRRTRQTHFPSSRSSDKMTQQTVSKSDFFIKNVILVPTPTTNRVPRGDAKEFLNSRGLVIDCYEFDKKWEQEELISKLSELFNHVLHNENQPLVKFEFVKAAGTKLTSINLPPGQQLSARIVKHVYGNGPVYIRALEELSCVLNVNQLDEENGECSNVNGNFEQELLTEMPPSFDYSLSESYETQNDTNSVEISSQPQDSNVTTKDESNNLVEILQDIFPQKQYSELVSVCSGCETLQEAIDILLDTKITIEDNENEDEFWMLPLTATKYRKLSGVESLRKFIRDVIKPNGDNQFLNITREESIIRQVIQKYKNPRFDLRNPLLVQFRSSGTAELGVDAGGPTTEYFFHLMNELIRGNLNGIRLFEGEQGHLLPRFDYDIISGNLMKLVGRMILHSIFNHCRGICGLSPAIVNYIITGKRDSVLASVDVLDVPDPCIRESLRELLSCSGKDLNKFMDCDNPSNIADIITSSGFPHIEITDENKDLAYECCLVHEVFTKRIPLLHDLRQGLMSESSFGVDLLNLVSIYPEARYLLFPLPSQVIDLVEMKKLVQYELGWMHNPDAAVSRDFMNKYLEEMSQREGPDEEKLGDLLQFWTCWPSLPMMDDKLSVTFLGKEPSKVLAVADTCFNALAIPTIHSSYEAFRGKMDVAVKYGKVGFGRP